jgi:starch phosphorylase
METMILKSIFVYPRLPDDLMKLHALAYNLWCTWNYDAIRLFYRIDAQLFRTVNHNPVQFLLSLPTERISQLAGDRGFQHELDKVWEQFQEYMQYDGQFKTSAGGGLTPDDVVAYFAMEFGLHECIPIYSGGLGVLSGDFLKAASDLNLPVVGIGLIYKYGYFTQRIGFHGEQEELFLEFNNHFVPMRELRLPEGDKAYLEMRILNEPLHIKLWQMDAGKTRLILLDTDIEENPPHLRDITQELYVSDRAKRLQQELVLGIGGITALERLEIQPRMYHINEGHSAFLIVARLQRLMQRDGLSFLEAKAVIRASTIFTTHTPVIAGNESFDLDLVRQYLEPEVESLDVSWDDLVSHGLINDDKKVFWLPAFAMRFSSHINAVSRLHRDVSRRMWASLFPDRPEVEIPIGHVTNGVHHSWLSEPLGQLLERHIGPDYIRCADKPERWVEVLGIDDEEVWQAHHRNKQSLITFIRKKLADDLAARGYIEPRILRLTRALNPEYLTIVFARRFARYKRPTLILKDKDRLAKILGNSTKPVQLIFAGKAHPADSLGKSMIKEIIDFARTYQLEDRVVFVENYDLNVARHLAWGADVWLNNPIRENEASGTSGMKAAINGVLNLSVPDGWWPEAYNGENGWAITGAGYHSQFEMQEAAEAGQIYDLIEEEITELYYDRDEAGVPVQWVERMKQSIYSVGCRFNMNRVLSEYIDKMYLPSRAASESLSQKDYEILRRSLQGAQELLRYWDKISIGELTTSVDKKEVVSEGEQIKITCKVDPHGAPPELFTVELFCMMHEQNDHRVIPMLPVETRGTPMTFRCESTAAGRGLFSMNARIRPASPIVHDLYPHLVKWAQ